MMVRLTSLRKKVFKTYLLLVLMFGLTGSLLIIVSTYIATGITPKAIHMNYDSIEAARLMQEAWQSLHHPEDRPGSTPKESIEQFETALRFAQGNITEADEAPTLKEITELWTQYKANPQREGLSRRMNALASQLAIINQKAMFKFIGEGSRLRSHVVIIASLFFVLCLLTAIYLGDRFATNISGTLKQTAEVLRAQPLPGEKLKLPTPDSLELRILVKEISDLWLRVSRTEQLNLEALVEQKAQLETLLSSVEDIVLILDNQERVAYMNGGFAELIGVSYEESIHHLWTDLPSSSENYRKLRKVLPTTNAKGPAIELSQSDARKVFEPRVRIVKGPHGNLIGTLYLLRDVTESRYREKLQAEFVGVLSHELKTPLQSLGTASELLVEARETFTARNKMLIETIADDVERIRNVANEFVQISKFPDLRSMSLRVKRVDLNEEIGTWVKPFQLIAIEKNVSLKLHLAEALRIWVEIDPIKFPWSVSNLLSNAVRVSTAGTEVSVSLHFAAGKGVITVRDQGPGIPEAFEKEMFEPFKKGAINGNEGILGLGLTIASEIASAHRGEIEYKAVEPHGAEFRIILPAEKESIYDS